MAVRVLCLMAMVASAESFNVASSRVASAVLPRTLSLVAAEAAEDASIQTQLKTRMKVAMKKGADGKQELGAVRLIVSAMTTKTKEAGIDELDDDAAIAVLTKLAKMRKESLEMYEKAGEEEKAAGERFELDLIDAYLPEQADEATVRGWVAAAIAEVCPDGPNMKMMGKVMGAINKAHGGGLKPEFSNPGHLASALPC